MFTMEQKTPKKNFIAKVMIPDDTCIFCGIHFSPCGGHCFIGKYNSKMDWYEDDKGGLLINEKIQICPECRKKYKINL